jgi:hypothetical protein
MTVLLDLESVEGGGGVVEGELSLRLKRAAKRRILSRVGGGVQNIR